MRRGLAIFLLAASLFGCAARPSLVQTPRGPIIDGWPVGAPADCASIGSCDELIRVATDGLAARDHFGSGVVSGTMHQYRQDEDGIFRSGGPPLIAVFQMSDGTVRAIGVKQYPADIPPLVIDFGP